MSGKATFIRETTDGKRLYETSGGKLPKYVVVSAVDAPFSGPFSGPETYIFEADAAGKILNWGELDGSYRGGLSHEQALHGAGYEVTNG